MRDKVNNDGRMRATQVRRRSARHVSIKAWFWTFFDFVLALALAKMLVFLGAVEEASFSRTALVLIAISKWHDINILNVERGVRKDEGEGKL